MRQPGVAWVILGLALLVGCASTPDPSTVNPAPEVEPDAPEATEKAWENAIDAVVPCVVRLRISVPRYFDTVSAKTTSGTGFVVDKERGLVLTNRHLVMPGPVISEATFQNHEEVALQAVYRDPIHDFGFYRFDPSTVQYEELCELPLAPEAARVGAELRVIGNDAGEEISILSGILARLDRTAPRYKHGTYNDFNTFYYQAASSTSGGSSGSPVINIDGQVIALNAGSNRRSAASYYLPLDRVVRALKLVGEQQHVDRGGLEVTLEHVAFEELARLNLRDEVRERAIAEGLTDNGMLVVMDVQPGGTSFGDLEVGDILVTLNGTLIDHFVPLETILDDHVGQKVTVGVERGGEPVELELEVANLHDTMPSEFIEISRSVIHEFSYQISRQINLPTEGIYLATSGYMFASAGIPGGSLLLEIEGQAISTLDEMWQALTSHPDGTRLRVRYMDLGDLTREQIGVIKLDRKWFPMRRCSRDDKDGTWPCTDAPAPPIGKKEPVSSGARQAVSVKNGGPGKAIAGSLLMVDFDIPYRTEGVWGSHFRGAGVIVDAEQGLVITDRDTVPIALGDVELTFAGTLRIPATIEMVHPIHNITVLRYDPADLGDTPVKAVKMAKKLASQNDEIWQVALNTRHQLVVRESTVDRLRPLRLPFPTSRPQFRESNLEIVTLADATGSVGGVLTNKKGEVQAFWMSFHIANDDNESTMRGMPADVVQLVLEQVRTGQQYRSLGVELMDLPLGDARDQGLPGDWVDRLAAQDPERLQVLTLERVFAGTPAAADLKTGDMILAVNGEVVTRFLEVEKATQQETALLTVYRDGTVAEIEVATVPLNMMGVDRAAMWGGMLMHEPHLEVASQYGLERLGVYAALGFRGGPTNRYDLDPTSRIVEVNGNPTLDLDAFLAATGELEDRGSVRLKILDLRDQASMLTLKLDKHFWPTYELIRSDGDWVRVP